LIPKSNQGDKRFQGKRIEKFVAKLFKAVHAKTDHYDLESKNHLIEVKSCQAFTYGVNKKRQETFNQCGRFQIRVANHVGMFLDAIKKNKIPSYVFVLKIGNHKIWKRVHWNNISIPIRGEQFKIHWKDVFC